MGAAVTMDALLLLLLLLLSTVVALVASVTVDRCDLARDLRFKYKLPAEQISQWLCLVQWESNYNTSAIGTLNADGSADHGLFQISDKFWCSGPGSLGEACGLTCQQLRDDDIKDDVICAKRVYRAHQKLTGNGFNAWEAWKIHCQGDTESYSDGCFDRAGDEAGDDGATWTTSTPYPL